MINFKRGDTFSYIGTASAVVNGVAVTDFSGWGARAQIRTKKGALVQELQVTWVQASTGKLTLMQTGDTSTWPVGPLEMDVRFTEPSGSLVSTNVLGIFVSSGVTR